MGRVSFAEDVKDSSIEEIDQEPVNVYEYQNTPENKSWAGALPLKQGLYDPSLEKDACGVGFAAHIKGKASHKIVKDGKSAVVVLRGTIADTYSSARSSLQYDPPRCGGF